MRLPARTISGLMPSGRLARPITQQIKASQAAGLMTAAQIQAMAYAAQTALQLSADLTTQEVLLTAVAPRGEGRYRVLVDQFTAAAASQIARMGWEW